MLVRYNFLQDSNHHRKIVQEVFLATKRRDRSPNKQRATFFIRSLLAALQSMWSLARLDLLLWRRMPWAIASALIPPLGMAFMLVVLSFTVTQEPVALVIQAQGAYSRQMAEMLEADNDAYALKVMNMQEATQALHDQEIAAIIVIPPDFDQQVIAHTARLQLTLNNIDIDFSDDIRRSVQRSIGQFDAAGLGSQVAYPPADIPGLDTSNPYLLSIDEHDLRRTNVNFLSYQVVPVFILLMLDVGLMGTALLCAQDRERGTARYLVIAPLSDWVFVAGRLLGGFCASCLAVSIAGGICLLFGVLAPSANHWPALAALLIATALSASGIGAILGTFLRGTRNIALAASLLATYFFFLGGGFTTIAFLPQWIQAISFFNPFRYAIDGMRQALFYPDLTGFSTDIAVLIGTAVVAIFLGSLVMRRSWTERGFSIGIQNLPWLNRAIRESRTSK
jgi:ABC-2 type transport system permease protein